ncbi:MULTISPECIES: oligosaccharide flippase family protein [Sphingobacterium]|uniref:oligosaccharide flippase family protein n=1 Tax=Sphingobacterium TaxID=28453 RepID=UPI00258017C3|nr:MULTISPECIES: oligosaccharide flippase family protein [Sphingobacterium]
MSVVSRINNLSDINKTILKSGFWILFGTIISKVLLLAASIIMVKFVNKNIYGEFGIVKSTINMFTVFAGMGLGLTTTKFIAQYKSSDTQKTARIIGLSNLFSITLCILMGALFIIFSKDLALQINAPHLKDSLKIGAIILVFSGLNGVQNGILGGFEKFKIISVNSIIASIFSTILQVVGAIFWGLNGIIVGFGINFLILFLLNQLSILKIVQNGYRYKIFDKRNFEELPLIWRFSVPAVLSGLMVSPVVWVTNNFLVNSPDGYHGMADFDIASQWRATVLFIPTALSQIVLPMLSSSKKQDFNIILKKNLLLNFAVSSIVVIGLSLFLPILIKLYGNGYDTARYPIFIMLITTIFIAVNNIVGNAIASMDKMWLGFFTNFVWAIVLISASYYLVSYKGFGAIGLSYAYLISYVSHSIVQFLIFKIYLSSNLKAN